MAISGDLLGRALAPLCSPPQQRSMRSCIGPKYKERCVDTKDPSGRRHALDLDRAALGHPGLDLDQRRVRSAPLVDLVEDLDTVVIQKAVRVSVHYLSVSLSSLASQGDRAMAACPKRRPFEFSAPAPRCRAMHARTKAVDWTHLLGRNLRHV